MHKSKEVKDLEFKTLLKEYELSESCFFNMNNANLRSLLAANRNFVDTFKMTYERESYADRWLAIKSMEYNQVLLEIREQYKQLFKNINSTQREEADRHDDFLENKIDSNVYKVFYGRNLDLDNVLESRERFDLESYYAYDE